MIGGILREVTEVAFQRRANQHRDGLDTPADFANDADPVDVG